MTIEVRYPILCSAAIILIFGKYSRTYKYDILGGLI